MPFISALGSTGSFGYHRNKTAATLTMWPTHVSSDPTARGGEFGLFQGQAATPASCPPPCKFRTAFKGQVGYEITTLRTLSITQLGRSGANLQSGAEVTIWDGTTHEPVARTTVDGTGKVVMGYTYSTLPKPVVLKAHTKYVVTQLVTEHNRDHWVDTNANAHTVLATFATIGNGAFGESNGYPSTESTPGRWAGIATFMVDAPVQPKSTQKTPYTCVCSVPAAPFGQGKGSFKYLPTGETLGFSPRCNLGSDAPSAGGKEGEDYSVMKNRNPTCDIRTYVGGLSTCHDGWHLLDAEQEIPWEDQPITYYLKYRLYFQEFTGVVPPASSSSTGLLQGPSYHKGPSSATSPPPSHINVFDITWSIAGATGEYDVPVCAAGTPVEQCKHEISGGVVPPGQDYHFVAAHYHCHAPTCLSLEIWNNRTGELLCREVPYHGGTLEGGDLPRFDEPGYIAQRVCLWGLHPPFERPPLVSGEPLWVKAVTNNTYGHHGEMALPQMLLARLSMR